ncbi:MAG: hypothetical protein KAS38_04450 [Anaerolineales bacterium]|nr:hypothetical protein [Anaerolineales bacterium]
MKEYEGSTYIGVVGGGIEVGACRDTIGSIIMRQGDTGPHYLRATKGYEARQQHLNIFIEQGQAFILLLDHDMYFSPDTLERLRSHKLPYVSGLYMRRQWRTLAPVWYRKFAGKWPMEPWVGRVADDKLHEIGASGWGCLLLHKDVVHATRKILKGEPEVIEDDIDIWPYDIKEVMRAINGLGNLSQTHEKIDAPLVKAYHDILKEEIKPLRCDRAVVGSDIRFPFFALHAGFQLIGDPQVKPGHNVNFPLSPDMYNDNFTDEQFAEATKVMGKETAVARGQITKGFNKVNNA